MRQPSTLSSTSVSFPLYIRHHSVIWTSVSVPRNFLIARSVNLIFALFFFNHINSKTILFLHNEVLCCPTEGNQTRLIKARQVFLVLLLPFYRVILLLFKCSYNINHYIRVCFDLVFFILCFWRVQYAVLPYNPLSDFSCYHELIW
jgi:hypothetical protein